MLGRRDGEVVFVPYSLPGERVRVRIERAKRDYATAQIIGMVRPSAERVEPRCQYFGDCGGCQWQHANYPMQLTMKQQIVVDQLRRLGGFAGTEDWVRPCIGMEDPWEYRNHVRFTLGRKYGDVGYTYRHSHRLLRVDACPIAHPAVNDVLQLIQRRCAGLRAHQITVRYGCNTGSLLVHPKLPMVPELETGQTVLEEEVLDRRFRISAASFFQVNTKRERRLLPEALRSEDETDRQGMFSMSDLLARLVLHRVAPQPDDVVLDAYCGVGTFAVLLAPMVERVVGIEESSAAVADARLNASHLANIEFVAGRSERVLLELSTGSIQAVVLDPSRLGCAPPVIQGLLDLRPQRVVYVSCDAATLARDLRALVAGGYSVDQVEPLDMFPQTAHIETVTTLTHA